MKKKTSISKLFLNKETVTILNNYQSGKIYGGKDTLVAVDLDTVAIAHDTVGKAMQDSLA